MKHVIFKSGEKKALAYFVFAVIPTLLLLLYAIKYQVSDVGGAKRDARVGHLPLIQHLAQNGALPNPAEYAVANIPLWHYLVSWIYATFESENSIRFFQVLMSITGLYFFYLVILKFASRKIALLATLTVAGNSYLVASTYFPTTDGLALNLFILFCWFLNRRLGDVSKIQNLFWLNVIIALSALNRQMFLFLFIIYGLAFLGKRQLSRIILDLLPAAIMVFVGFYLFYERYCQFRVSDACWPVRQSQDLFFPVLVNFSVVSFLVAFFCFPILYLNKEYAVVSKTKTVMIFFFVFIFYAIVGERVIQSGDFVVGGGIFKMRERLGDGALLFDSISVSMIILLVVISIKKLKQAHWALIAIFIVCASSFFGPFAFQRYYEPYILILVLIYLSANRGDVFGQRRHQFEAWVFMLLIFQYVETGLSLFVDI